MPGYKVTNMVGSQQTRAHRQVSASTHRSKQMIGHHRILPKQTVEMSEEHFKAHESAVLAKVQSGELMVTCPDGTTITSMAGGKLIYRKPTGQVEVKAAPTAAPPAPVVETIVAEVAPLPPVEKLVVRVEDKVEVKDKVEVEMEEEKPARWGGKKGKR